MASNPRFYRIRQKAQDVENFRRSWQGEEVFEHWEGMLLSFDWLPGSGLFGAVVWFVELLLNFSSKSFIYSA